MLLCKSKKGCFVVNERYVTLFVSLSGPLGKNEVSRNIATRTLLYTKSFLFRCWDFVPSSHFSPYFVKYEPNISII